MVVRGVVAARRRPCLTPGRQPQVTRAARLLRPTQATAAHEAPVALVSARARRLSVPPAVRARPSPFPRTGGAPPPPLPSPGPAPPPPDPPPTPTPPPGGKPPQLSPLAPSESRGVATTP